MRITMLIVNPVIIPFPKLFFLSASGFARDIDFYLYSKRTQPSWVQSRA